MSCEQGVPARRQALQLLGGELAHLGVAARGQLLGVGELRLDAPGTRGRSSTSGSISASALACLRYSLASLWTSCDADRGRDQLS